VAEGDDEASPFVSEFWDRGGDFFLIASPPAKEYDFSMNKLATILCLSTTKESSIRHNEKV
jgi:hypothetical protein